MQVTVWSTVAGCSAGYTVLTVDGNNTVDDLLELHCQSKGVTKDRRWQLRNSQDKALVSCMSLTDAGIKTGDTIVLVPGSESNGVYKFGPWYVLSYMFIILALFGAALLTFQIYFSHASTQDNLFGIVIDAESTQSTFYVFQWKESSSDLVVPDSLEIIVQCTQDGPVSSLLSNDESTVKNYLAQCLGECHKNIPRSLHSKTPLYFVATAWMRIIKDFDPYQASHLMDLLYDVLTASSSYLIKRDHVVIVSGEVEGVSGWLAANYVIGKLGKNVSTTATLDAEGSSVQLTHVGDINSSVTLTVNDASYQLHSHTFMCFGIFESRKRQKYLLLETTNSNENKMVRNLPNEFEAINEIDHNHIVSNPSEPPIISVEDPCLPVDASTEVSRYELLTPCTLSVLGHNNLKKSVQSRESKREKFSVKPAIQETRWTINEVFTSSGKNEDSNESLFDKNFELNNYLDLDNNNARASFKANLIDNYRIVFKKMNISTNNELIWNSSPFVNGLIREIISASNLAGEPMVVDDVRYLDDGHSLAAIELNRTYATSAGILSVNNDQLFKMIGAGNGRECMRQVNNLFDDSVCAGTFRYGACLSKSPVPNLSQDLLAYSDAFTIISKIHDIPNISSLARFRQSVLNLCSLNLIQVVTHCRLMAGDISVEHPEELCYQSVYLYTLLTKGLGYTEDTWRRVNFQNNVHSKSVEWTNGYMLNRIYSQNRTQVLEEPIVWDTSNMLLLVLLTVLVLCFLITATLILAMWRIVNGPASAQYHRDFSDGLDARLLGV